MALAHISIFLSKLFFWVSWDSWMSKGWAESHLTMGPTDPFASNTPAAPRVYRIKFKRLRLEFKTCSTWLQWPDSSQHEFTFWPFPLFTLSTGVRSPFLSPPPLPFPGLAQMPSSHNHSPWCTASSEVWKQKEGMCRPQRPAKIQVSRTPYLM